MSKKPDLLRRNDALQATQQRFCGEPMDLGRIDCIKMVRFHLGQMGHRNLPKANGYSSARGAKKVLKRLGFESLEQLFDSILPRIAPAAMLPGDIALVASEPDAPAFDVGTAVISVGRKFLGWHPDHPTLAVIEPTVDAPFTAAWRA